MPGGIFFVIKKPDIPPPYVPPEPEEGDFIFDPETYASPEGDETNFIFT